MKSSERLTLAHTLEKAGFMGPGIAKVTERVAPSLLHHVGNLWHNAGWGARLGVGAAGAGAAYGGYKMLQPNRNGLIGRIGQSAQQETNSLNQLYKGFGQ